MLVRGRTSDSGIAAPTTPDNGVARRHPSPPMGCRLLLCWGFILSLGIEGAVLLYDVVTRKRVAKKTK